MTGTLFFSFVASMVTCMALIPLLAASAGRLRFIDLPGDRKVHTDPIAKIGGLAFAAGTFVATLMWAPKDQIVLSSFIGGGIILLFGAWDDRVELRYPTKFFGQFLAAVTVVWFGDVHLDYLPLLSDTTMPSWVSFPLTVMLIVGVTNAINLADGLDGLAGGLTLLSFASMACLAYVAGDPIVLLMMVSILGGLLGFLRFNTYPARIFMGDAGSQFLGYFLAVAAVVLTNPLRGPYTPALVFFLLGLPILDTLGVMTQRLREGRSPFVADKNHLHHKLLTMGLSHHEAVLAIYSLQASMVSLAYVLRWQHDLIVLGCYALVAGFALTPFITKWDPALRVSRSNGSTKTPSRWLDHAKAVDWLSHTPIHVLAIAVPTFLVLSVFLPPTVPRDMGHLAGIIWLALVIGMVLLPRFIPLLVRTGLYVGSTFVMYLSEEGEPHIRHALQTPLTILFLLLALLVMLTIRFNSGHRFQTTPLDYLMVFLALIIPILPDMRIGNIAVSVLTAKLLVLFFSFELLIHAYAHRVWQLGLVSLWLLLGLVIRGWWS